MRTARLTMAQALVRFLAAQRVERDGVEQPFFAGCFGIFGHGNVAGVGQALYERPDLLRYHLARNEQGMVHAAAGFARARNRLAAFACTSSIGPGATNMVTGAAAATINRLPVLLLPGDAFASRRPDPVLQQMETPARGDVSVNDTLQPVSRYWDRISRPEQLIPAALAAMRVLTNQAETGAVTLALPQDVQAEAHDYPLDFLEERCWHVGRPLPDAGFLDRAVAAIRAAERPLLVAGGGVIYSEATEALQRLSAMTGIPVAETQAGKGSMPWDDPLALGAIGVSGGMAANVMAADADLVIGVGTRWADFTTASKTAFQAERVRFVNLNIADFDAGKLSGLPLVGDARSGLEELSRRLAGWRVADEYRSRAQRLQARWQDEVTSLYNAGHEPLPAQSEVIGAVNAAAGPRDVVVCAAGSMPSDLHKLWRTRDPKGYHVEYGYSTMGYEIAGALGVKLADPTREVYSLVGDGSFLMMAQEIATSIQEGLKLTIVLVDNDGFASIGALSRALGTAGFGTRYLVGADGGLVDDSAAGGSRLPLDLAASAAGLGAHVIRADGLAELREALVAARAVERTVLIEVRADRYHAVPAYESWWDVPVAEVSETPAVREARSGYDHARAGQRWHLE